MRSLSDLCKPRKSVFDRARLDTVYNLDDLPTINPDEFLSENYVTEGMSILLTEAFNRLEGKTHQCLRHISAQSVNGRWQDS